MKFSDTEKAVFRHYYRKLKKQTRGGKFADGLSGYMPDHSKPSSLLWRGTNRTEVEAISDNGKFISRWQHFLRPGSSRTWVTSRPKIAESYAAHGSVRDSRIYAISPAAFKRVDNKVRDQMSGTTVTAPIRGGIFRHEVRGILKGSDGGLDKYGQKKLRWRPASLGDVQNRNFSAKLRLRELARGDLAIPALGKMLRDRSFLEEFIGRRRGPKLGDLRIIPHRDPSVIKQGFVDKRDWGWVDPTDPTITQAARSTPNSLIGDPRMRSGARVYRAEVAKMIRRGRAGGDVYGEIL